MTNELSEANLAQFTGTGTWYKHPLAPGITYTDGAKYVAEKGGAYWLLDIIATNNAYGGPEFKREEFQVWRLVVDIEKNSGVLTCSDGGKDGHKSKVFYTQEIDYTDFPLPEITLWFQNNTIFLPSEY